METQHKHHDSCHAEKKGSFDFFLWGSIAIITAFYLIKLLSFDFGLEQVLTFSDSVFDLMNKVWWGIAIGMIMVGVLSKVPREFVISLLGNGKGLRGILRATFAGVLLDLCSHGILMVGVKLYQKGLSIGQVMAFLIASPWNSFSLTLILIALIGFKWTILFIVFSMIIAIISGWIFNKLVDLKILPANEYSIDLPQGFNFVAEVKSQFAATDFTPKFFGEILWEGLIGSKIVIRWTFFGVIVASLIRTFVSTEHFQNLFGPSLFGLAMTVIAATVIEVCSEGSTPIAADILTRANAPGNSFAFLMTGVATDYTEIMSIKSATKSWLIALFLPLITVPQVVLVAWLINN